MKIRPDLVSHAAVGMAVVALFGAPSIYLLLPGVAVAGVLAKAKEKYDAKSGGVVDKDDIWATVAGAMVMALWMYVWS